MIFVIVFCVSLLSDKTLGKSNLNEEKFILAFNSVCGYLVVTLHVRSKEGWGMNKEEWTTSWRNEQSVAQLLSSWWLSRKREVKEKGEGKWRKQQRIEGTKWGWDEERGRGRKEERTRKERNQRERAGKNFPSIVVSSGCPPYWIALPTFWANPLPSVSPICQPSMETPWHPFRCGLPVS